MTEADRLTQVIRNLPDEDQLLVAQLVTRLVEGTPTRRDMELGDAREVVERIPDGVHPENLDHLEAYAITLLWARDGKWRLSDYQDVLERKRSSDAFRSLTGAFMDRTSCNRVSRLWQVLDERATNAVTVAVRHRMREEEGRLHPNVQKVLSVLNQVDEEGDMPEDFQRFLAETSDGGDDFSD